MDEVLLPHDAQHIFAKMCTNFGKVLEWVGAGGNVVPSGPGICGVKINGIPDSEHPSVELFNRLLKVKENTYKSHKRAR